MKHIFSLLITMLLTTPAFAIDIIGKTNEDQNIDVFEVVVRSADKIQVGQMGAPIKSLGQIFVDQATIGMQLATPLRAKNLSCEVSKDDGNFCELLLVYNWVDESGKILGKPTKDVLIFHYRQVGKKIVLGKDSFEIRDYDSIPR